MNTLFLDKLNKALTSKEIRMNEKLSKYNTFRIGGPADYLVRIENKDKLKKIIRLCHEHGIKWKLIGNGSNLVFSDNGWQGLIIKNEMNRNIRIEKTDINGEEQFIVSADAGVLLSRFSKVLAEHELQGYAFASGIPGTLGGAIVMNAGAYGGEISDYILNVTVLDKNGDEHVLLKEDLSFSYRHSIIKQEEYIVLEASFRLYKGIKTEIYKKMDEYNKARKEKQPLEYPSAGSAFKRPEGTYAGKLIMEAGLSGFTVGGAKVSEKHCGFIINIGGASADDVRKLINIVQKKVKEHSGYELEPEIEFVGDKTVNVLI